MNESAKDKLIIALDVETARAARELFATLGDYAGMFKIGSQLFTAAGPQIVREIVAAGGRVFLDLKFHDIPNTVAAASVEAVRLGVSIFNIHALGGSEMMRRAAEAATETAARENLLRPAVIAVTVLTSSDQEMLEEVGIERAPEQQVRKLTGLAASCGLDGVVASPHEIRVVRSVVERNGFLVERSGFLIVTPGVRLSDAAHQDQKRVMTPAEAVRAGADYLVAGRHIIGASDPARAAHGIIEDMERAGAQA